MMWEGMWQWAVVVVLLGVVLWVLRWLRGRDGAAVLKAIEGRAHIDIPDRVEPALASGLNWALDRAIDGVEALAAKRKMPSAEKLGMAVQIADSITNRLGLVDLAGERLAGLIEARLLERGMVHEKKVLSPVS